MSEITEELVIHPALDMEIKLPSDEAFVSGGPSEEDQALGIAASTSINRMFASF
jgi:hypothetical protein